MAKQGAKIGVGNIELYYEVHGHGYPFLFIRGLGSNILHWYEQIPVFSPSYRVIVFDNRGIGRSGDAGEPFTISTMVSDTIALMDALEIQRAHILGLSMGGMIAQEIAIQHPQRVERLILACTHCGGRHQVPPQEKIKSIFTRMIYSGSNEAKREASVSLFARETLDEHPEIVEQYMAASLRFPAPEESLVRQWEAVEKHDTWERLPAIEAPTLVLTGDQDRLIPPKNSRILAERIPHARLAVIEGGAHQVLVERAEAANRALLDFMNDPEPGDPL